MSGPCVCIGGGGGCSVANTTVQEYLAGFGIPYNPNDPLGNVYPLIISQRQPNTNATNAKAWAQLAEACMRARALLYCKTNPGDCGSATAPANFGTISQVGSSGIQAGSEIASLLGVGGTALSVGTLGAGAALETVIDLFTSHAKAEATQANALCQICPQFSSSIQSIDSAVVNRQISPTQALTYIQSLVLQFKSSIGSLLKQCNAFCGYAAIAQCLADQSAYLYGVTAIPGSVASLAAPVAENENLPAIQGIPGTLAPVSNLVNAGTFVATAPLATAAPLVSLPAIASGSISLFGFQVPTWIALIAAFFVGWSLLHDFA